MAAAAVSLAAANRQKEEVLRMALDVDLDVQCKWVDDAGGTAQVFYPDDTNPNLHPNPSPNPTLTLTPYPNPNPNPYPNPNPNPRRVPRRSAPRRSGYSRSALALTYSRSGLAQQRLKAQP